MLVIAASNKLQANLGEATVTTEGDFTTWFYDSGSPPTASRKLTKTNGVTSVDVMVSPASGWIRQLKGFVYKNRDTVQHSMRVWYYDGAAQWGLSPSITVPPNGSVTWTNEAGWQLVTANGLAVGPPGTDLLIDGSIAAPSLAFLNETGLGLRRVSAGVLGVAQGGVDILRASSLGLSTNAGVDNLKYETGTWTPTLTADTAGTPTYSTRLGWYVRLGKLVFAQMALTITAKGTIAGTNLRVDGLPFISDSTANMYGNGAMSRNNLAISASYCDMMPWVNPNTASLYFVEAGSAANNANTVNATVLNANTAINADFLYRIP